MGKANDMVRMKKGWSRAGAIIAGAVLAISGGVAVAPVAGAAGATLYVATTGTDDGDCGTEAAPCATIQFAINRASAGDIVQVAAGEYITTGADLTVGFKPITLRGPQAGVDPVGSSVRSVGNTANEAVIKVTGGTGILDVHFEQADASVVIDGFTFEDTSISRVCAGGDPGLIEVRNNIFNRPAEHPNGAGQLARTLFANCSSFVAENNVFVGNPDYKDSSAAYLAAWGGGNVTFTGNGVSDYPYSGLMVINATDVTITDNMFDSIQNSAVHLHGLKGVNNVVAGNTITNTNLDGGDDGGNIKFGAIRIKDSCTSAGACSAGNPVVIKVTGNKIDGAAYALVMNSETGVAGSEGYSVQFNENSVTNIGQKAIVNDGAESVQAADNWWGTPMGVADLMDGDGVVFEPYYIGPEMQELSDGTGAPIPSPNPSSVENLFGSLTASS